MTLCVICFGQLRFTLVWNNIFMAKFDELLKQLEKNCGFEFPEPAKVNGRTEYRFSADGRWPVTLLHDGYRALLKAKVLNLPVRDNEGAYVSLLQHIAGNVSEIAETLVRDPQSHQLQLQRSFLLRHQTSRDLETILCDFMDTLEYLCQAAKPFKKLPLDVPYPHLAARP